ncbi:hypothetical protein [Flavobacterium sp.]|jgi:predicted transcriptional regulator|uniref:hypothetical protein n=1 Tax=Flavobacterium sp. TaxID=239 RepID=UPI003BCCEA1A
MQDRGEILKQVVYNSGMSISELAKRMGKSRKWVYNQFENKSVSLDLILQIGEIIHHNFVNEIDDLCALQNGMNSTSSDNNQDNESNDYWKNKYLSLLEDYNKFLKENITIMV